MGHVYEIATAPALERLAAFLLPRGGDNGSPASVRAIRWEDGRATVELLTLPEGLLRVFIEQRSDGRPFFIQTAHLNVSYEGAMIRADHARILEEMSAFIHDLTLDDIVSRFKSESHRSVTFAEAGAAAGTGGGGPAGHEMRSAASLWGSSILGDQFLAENMREGSGVQMNCDMVLIAHAEFECNFVRADLPHYRSYKFNEACWPESPFPYVSRGPGRCPSTRRRPRVCSVFTDIHERDAVMGGCEKLENALAMAAEDPEHAMCYINTACVPTIIGDDIEGPVALYKSRCDRPLLSHVTGGSSDLDNAREIMQQRASKPGFLKTKKRSNAINLVGYTEEDRFDDTRDRLRELGIDINVDILPLFSPDDIDTYMKARVQVLRPDAYFRDIYKDFFEKLPIATLAIEAPYGPRRSRAWLKALAAAVNSENELGSLWRAWWSPLDRQWGSMQRQAEKYTLAFVLRLPQLQRFVDPWMTRSVPIMQAIEEMGFNMALLAGAGDKDSSVVLEEAERIFAKAHVRPPAVIRVFHDTRELSDLLNEGGFHAVYSEFAFDRRLVEAGLNRFSYKTFSMGVSGAVKTFQRLLAICSLPFYRRYKKYFMNDGKGHGA
jgi:hypothetical protein